MIFLIATQNKHKKVEFERILAPLGIEIKTAGELGLPHRLSMPLLSKN